MAPKRRGGRRAASQSQSQSQTQSQSTQPLHPVHASQPEDSQVGSYYQSSLPPPENCLVTVALRLEDIPLDDERVEQLQKTGGEAIEDTRGEREGVRFGRIDVQWSEKGVKRRKLGHSGVEYRGEPQWDDEQEGLWFSAGLSFPCICQLAKWSHAYQPRHPPPLASKLHILPLHEDPSERPIPTHQLPEWSTFISGSKECMVDLDPSLDDLREFEPAWRDADGGWGRGWDAEEVREKPTAGPSRVKRDTRGVIVSTTEAIVVLRDKSGRPLDLAPNEWWKEFSVQGKERHKEKEAEKENKADKGKEKDTESPRKKSKGKAKAAQPMTAFRPQMPIPMGPEQAKSTSVPTPRSAPPTPSGRAKTVEVTATAVGGGAAVDWQAESKRRKQIWRGMIEADGNYGQMWQVIKEPHSYPPRYIKPPKPSANPQTQLRDFVLPRALAMNQHPYHPSLSHYISQHPFARLYWLIPINGPIHIPGVNSLPHPTTGNPHALAPSISSLSTTQPFVEPTTRPFPLLWTPPLLLEFMSQLVTKYKNPDSGLGSISIRLSGPKPDAYIDLPAPHPLSTHVHLPPSTPTTTPVRPECGDHIRIYVDARHCLAFRTWLHSVDIPWSEVGDHGTRHAHDKRALVGNSSFLSMGSSGILDTQMEGGPYSRPKKGVGLKVFNKVRLALVGEKGEVLVVA